MGACHGKAGFDAFTHEKSVLKKGRLDIPVRLSLIHILWEYPNELSPAPCPVEAAGLSGGPAGKHIFSHIEWHMTAQIVEAASPELPEGWVWADRAALERDYAVPNAFQAFAGAVEARL